MPLCSNAAAVTVTRVLPTVLPSSRCTLLALESRSFSFLSSIQPVITTHICLHTSPSPLSLCCFCRRRRGAAVHFVSSFCGSYYISAINVLLIPLLSHLSSSSYIVEFKTQSDLWLNTFRRREGFSLSFCEDCWLNCVSEGL